MSKFGSESELGKWQKILHLLMPRNCCLKKYYQKVVELTFLNLLKLPRIWQLGNYDPTRKCHKTGIKETERNQKKTDLALFKTFSPLI